MIMPGVHQPSCQFDVAINLEKWKALPEDLKQIVETSAKETQLWSNAWSENLNIEALKILSAKSEFVKMDDATMVDFAKASFQYLDDLKTKHPDVKKTLDSQEKFKDDFATWRDMRGRLAPWPNKDVEKGRLLQ
jgi:TRAP-type mannitol/chloroaromatic compound transport system substrate-binding protein